MKSITYPSAIMALLAIFISTPAYTNEDIGSIVWKNWYLSVPVKRSDSELKATSIYYNDIINNNLTEEQSEFFYPNEDGSNTFYTRYTTFTTSGYYNYNTSSKYCRTELREFYRGNQSTSDNWSMDEGLHQMESTLRVQHCPDGVKGIYVAQIHGTGDSWTKSNTQHKGSPASVKVLYQPDGNLKLEYYTAPQNPSTTEWSSKSIRKIELGNVGDSIFTIKIRVQNGVLSWGLTCEDQGIDVDYTDLYDYKSNGYDYRNYFKTGNYFAYNGSDQSIYSEVILYGVETVHE